MATTQVPKDAPTARQPNCFEHSLNVYVKKVQGKRVEDGDLLNMEIEAVVVNAKDFDRLLAMLFGKSGAAEYVEDGAHALKSMHFSEKFKDHQAKFRVSSQTVANLPNVELTAFHIDISQMQMSFKVNAKGLQEGVAVGKLTEVLGRAVHLEVKRAKHWSANVKDQQSELGLDEVNAEHQAKKERIERAKDKANQNNTAKVNEALKKRTEKAAPKAKEKAAPKKKAAAKKKAAPKKKAAAKKTPASKKELAPA